MVKVLNMAGSEVGEVELNASIFGITPNMHVVHEVVKQLCIIWPASRSVRWNSPRAFSA